MQNNWAELVTSPAAQLKMAAWVSTETNPTVASSPALTLTVHRQNETMLPAPGVPDLKLKMTVIAEDDDVGAAE